MRLSLLNNSKPHTTTDYKMLIYTQSDAQLNQMIKSYHTIIYLELVRISISLTVVAMGYLA